MSGRVTLATWPPHREDPGFGGLFAALPTLTWDGDTVSETLSIASYIAKRLGHYDGLEAVEIAKHEAVVSCSYLDVVRSLADVLWAPILYPGADVATTTPRILGSSLGKLGRLSTLLPDGGSAPWLGGSRPASAFLARVTCPLACVLVIVPSVPGVPPTKVTDDIQRSSQEVSCFAFDQSPSRGSRRGEGSPISARKTAVALLTSQETR